jgi:hypothetical protein
MGLLRYLLVVIKTACKHSFHAAHSIILVLIIIAGLATYFVPGIEIMVDLHGWEVATIVLCSIVGVRLFLAPYWIWKADQKRIGELSSNDADARVLEIIFDENDPDCVRQDRGSSVRRWWVGIRNASDTRSVDNISLRVRNDQFVECTIKEANYPYGEIARSSGDPIIFETDTLPPPHAREFVELFGMGPEVRSEGDILARKHQFTLEARGRDAQTVLAVLEYDPAMAAHPPTIRRIS